MYYVITLLFGELVLLSTGSPNGSKAVAPSKDEDSAKSKLLSYLRDMRVEFQAVRKSFSDIIELSSSPDKELSSVETVELHDENYKKYAIVINDKLKMIEDVFNSTPSVLDYSDTVMTIKDKWGLVEDLHKNYNKDNTKKVSILRKCVEYLEDAVYWCNIATVPPRLKEHLKTTKAGYTLNFYEEFKDEFCSEKQASELLKYLARHQSFVDDIIDTSQGLILKVEPKKERWKGYLRIIGAFLVGICGVALFFYLFKGQIFTINYMKLYLIFLSGALFHISIDSIKSTKSSTGIQFKSVDDWITWINIKELSIIFGILLLDFTFIGLLFYLNEWDPNKIDRLTLLAAGYSFDSIGEVFSNRFENILSKKATALKENISSA